MAKVKNPLFSQKASGNLGGSLSFVCGHFVKKRQTEKRDTESESQAVIQNKFSDGAFVWSNVMTDQQRATWDSFSDSNRIKNGCYQINIFGNLITVCPGVRSDQMECIKTASWNGYQCFMAAYMRFGPDGWYRYPWSPSF